jgi:polysaccharide biosynthesis transport protein
MEENKHRKTIEISDVFAIAWKRKWLIVLPMLIVTAIAFAGSYMITPEYQSSVIIWLGNQVQLSNQIRQIVGDAGNVLGSTRNLSAELQSLQNEVTSTPYVRQLIDRLGLDKDPALDREVQKMRLTYPELTAEDIKFDMILNNLRENIAIGSAGWEQVRISVQSPDPFRARDMAQNLGEILMAEKMKQELGAVRVSQDFTYEQLNKYESDLQAKIDEKTSFEKKFMGYQVNQYVVSDSNRNAINSEIAGINSDIEEKKSEERTLIGKLSNIPSGRLTLQDSPALTRYKAETQALLLSIATLMPKYRWSDPEILNFKTRLYNYIGNIEDENKRLVDEQYADYDKPTRTSLTQLFDIRSELDILYSKVNNLKLALADLTTKINSVPEYQAKIDQLTREINAARDLRDRFREQQAGSQISQALLRESRFQVIEPAKVPFTPVTPNRPKILVMGIVLGIMLGAGAALLAELMDNTLKKVEDVEELVGLPILGIIPEIEAIRRNFAKSQ